MFTIIAVLLALQCPEPPVAAGVASYYTEAENGTATASGEVFRDDLLTFAMRHGEMGRAYLIVSDTGAAVVCRLNDRGPWIKGRVADLSLAAIRVLHPTDGLIRVTVHPLP